MRHEILKILFTSDICYSGPKFSQEVVKAWEPQGAGALNLPAVSVASDVDKT